MISLFPVAMIFLATELPGAPEGLLTTSLTGPQWLACIGLALLLPVVIEVEQVDPPAPRRGADRGRRAAARWPPNRAVTRGHAVSKQKRQEQATILRKAPRAIPAR